jgi:hypothetical protein
MNKRLRRLSIPAALGAVFFLMIGGVGYYTTYWVAPSLKAHESIEDQKRVAAEKALHAYREARNLAKAENVHIFCTTNIQHEPVCVANYIDPTLKVSDPAAYTKYVVNIWQHRVTGEWLGAVSVVPQIVER